MYTLCLHAPLLALTLRCSLCPMLTHSLVLTLRTQVYYVYGFMLLVFVILLIVTVCVTIVGTYFLLNAENYHWPWTSFAMAASTSVYVFLYSVHYFVFKTHMTGFFQTAFYFGYTAMFCTGLGLMCGALGYWGASLFVRTIYKTVKAD